MSVFILVLNILAICIGLAGSIVCFRYAFKCRNSYRNFYFLAGMIQMYTASIYALAVSADLYIIKAGIMTRLAAIAYAGLLTSWAIVHSRKCDHG